ncbi:MAG: 50S ribosomal protein L11 methyltransferase [Desulfobulbaceae bacterium]|nr:50S ribosomal protein L11 methyltransferase [Desulfobulbaceae bacterium]
MHPSLSLLDRWAPLSPVSGCQSILAHQASDIFALWQAWEKECGTIRDVPYWAIVWPAAQVLAEYIAANASLVIGKSVLDCGCGCGVAAIAAMTHGALHATGCDLDASAIFVGDRNASSNTVNVSFVCQDVINLCNTGRFGLILVADLFYQRDFAADLLAALTEAHHRGCDVIIADSGRPFLAKETLIEIHSQTAVTSFDVEGCRSRTVRLYRFKCTT